MYRTRSESRISVPYMLPKSDPIKPAVYRPTVRNRRYPVEDCSPEIGPPDKVEIVWPVRTAFLKDIVDGLVEDRDGSWTR
jgi:hypothetical protein